MGDVRTANRGQIAPTSKKAGKQQGGRAAAKKSADDAIARIRLEVSPAEHGPLAQDVREVHNKVIVNNYYAELMASLFDTATREIVRRAQDIAARSGQPVAHVFEDLFKASAASLGMRWAEPPHKGKPFPAGKKVALKMRAGVAIKGQDTKKATRKPLALPALPKGLKWPTVTFSQSHEKHGWDIIQHLDKHWLPILEAARRRGKILATRRILAARDPSAIMAITNFTRPHPKTGERERIPDRLHFPTLKEENDFKLKTGGLAAITKDRALARVVLRRIERGVPVPS